MAEGLDRFVEAQDQFYPRILAELRAGEKRSHWMWFVFPQLVQLGRSAMAQRYGIADIAEARAYLAHPLLGPRLTECTEAMLAHAEMNAETILGGIDALKFASAMTLFEAAGGPRCFAQALDRFYAGLRDQRTRDLLA